MSKYGDVEYAQEDIERIIADTGRRLEDLEQCWDAFTKHMECGEIRELKQSCIDDEIILSCLREAKYYKHLIKTFTKLNEDLKVAAESVVEHIPECQLITNGNYVFRFDSDIWDMETAAAFYEKMVEAYPDCAFSMLPYGMEVNKIN